MFDPTTLSALASSAVTVLAPLLKKTLEKGAEELGKLSVNSLLDKLKQKLSHAGTREALDDLAVQPDDTAAQGALAMQLRKALASDPGLVAFLKQWVVDSESIAGISQAANVQGHGNTTTQIAGSGNSISSM